MGGRSSLGTTTRRRFEFGQGRHIEDFAGDGLKGHADVTGADQSCPLRIVGLEDLSGADEPIAQFDVAEPHRLRPVVQRQVLHSHVLRFQQLNGAVNGRGNVRENGQTVTLHDVRQVELRFVEVRVLALTHALALCVGEGWNRGDRDGGGGGLKFHSTKRSWTCGHRGIQFL